MSSTEVDLHDLRKLITSNDVLFTAEEISSRIQSTYRIVRGLDRWLVSVKCSDVFRNLGYFKENMKLILGQYSKFRLSDERVKLFQFILDNIDTVPLFLKITKGRYSNGC